MNDPTTTPRRDGRANQLPPIPADRPHDLRAVMDLLEGDRALRRNIVHRHVVPAQPARAVDLPESLAPELRAVLRARGFDQLYTHQADCVEHALAGRHSVVVTPTASGKSLCYTLPVLQSLLADPQARALALFPTKALAQDQLQTLLDLAQPLGRDIKIYTFDGDTPPGARRAIRQAGHVVVTNPDMLHTGILPHHTLWVRLFENLKYVVIDEVHTYRGVFGSHVANVLRRLARLCAFYGAKPTFICCSATIANPRELCETLTGLNVELVDRNGAPRAARAIYFYNPPVVNEELGIRRSVVKESRRIAMRFIGAGLQTIVFARTRARVEILTTYLRRSMARLRRDARRISGYRGGYLPEERRAIERGIKSGAILGVVSTNALELGIDIGQLRVAVLTGYPGTVASLWQQAGRAGRKDQPAAVVFCAASAPLDQFLVQNPEYLLGAPPEHGIVNPENVAILSSQIKCAAFELPFRAGERFGPEDPAPVLEWLEREGVVRRAGDRYHWAENAYPAEDVSLRRPTPENFLVKDATRQNQIIAEVDYDAAPFLIHEKAIYIHDGTSYHVDKLDWAKRLAFVRPIKTDYYTDAIDKTDIRVLDVEHRLFAAGASTEEEADAAGADPERQPEGWPLLARAFGEITVQTIVPKFKKVRFETHEPIGFGDIFVPLREMQTECAWWTLRADFPLRGRTMGMDPSGALVGLANLIGQVTPLLVMCDPRDVRCLAMMKAPHDDRPAIYLYDNYPGGIGLARRAFGMEKRVLAMARQLVEHCACRSGCPSCVGPPLELGEGAKASTLKLLQLMQAAQVGLV